jgi:hypothetical protein
MAGRCLAAGRGVHAFAVDGILLLQAAGFCGFGTSNAYFRRSVAISAKIHCFHGLVGFCLRGIGWRGRRQAPCAGAAPVFGVHPAFRLARRCRLQVIPGRSQRQ